MRDRYLAMLLVGFAAGVAVGTYFSLSWAFAIFIAIIGFSVLISASRVLFVVSVSIFLLALSLGLLRVEVETYRYENELSFVRDKSAHIVGVVSEFPDRRENKTHFVIETEKVSVSNSVMGVKEKLLVISNIYPRVEYGDRVSIIGTVKAIENFETEENAHFNYERYLSKDGIFNEVVFPKLAIISKENGDPLIGGLFSVREAFSEQLRSAIREPESSLALGMLLGEKHGLSKSILDTFKRAAVIHIVVLSGYNISLVSQFFTKIFSFLPLIARSSAGAIGIILFILMTGGGASVIRAGIMALIALIGLATGRTYDAGRALFVAGFIMLMENPNILLYDPSFQLSFIATLGLIYLSPIIMKFLSRPRRFSLPNWANELIAQTFATQVAVLPMLIYLSGTISLIGFFSNLLIVPFVAVAMLFGFITGILSFLGQFLATPAALISSAVLSYIINVSEFFSSLPFTMISAGIGAAIVVTMIYAVAGYYLYLSIQHAEFKK